MSSTKSLTLAVLSLLVATSTAQSDSGGQGYVDLSTYGGVPQHLAAGILYGVPNDPAYDPDTAPSRDAWGPLFQAAGISSVRAGGAQIPYPGYANYLQTGNMTGYQKRFASTLQNYRDTMALNPDAIFVLLHHDLWGRDGPSSGAAFPCDDNDCSGWSKFLDQLIGDLKTNDMLKNLHIDIWNEPDGSFFWPAYDAYDQYHAMYITAWDAYRNAFGDSVNLQAPTTGYSPADSGGKDWWDQFGQFLQSNKSRIPDTFASHQFSEGRNAANCGNDPVDSQNALNELVAKYGLSSRPLQINEYGAQPEQTPGYTAWFIERLERIGSRGMRSNFGAGVGLHNDFAALLGPGGQDNSAGFYKRGEWHVFNYYTQTQKGFITLAGSPSSKCFDLFATQDRAAGTVNILAGTRGQTGAYPITVSKVSALPAFSCQDSLRATIHEIPFNNGGRVDSPALVSDATVSVQNDQVVVTVNMALDSAYTIDLTPGNPGAC